MAKRSTSTTPKLGSVNLSAEVKEELSKQAQASILEEMTQAERTRYFEQERERYRREQVPEDTIVHVLIDVAPYIPFIMLDGTQYFHGYTYPVASKVRCVILEQMQRSWAHQDEIDGRSKTEAYRRPRDMRIGPNQAGSATRGANGAVVAEV